MIPWFELKVVIFGPITIQVWGFFVAFGIAFSTLMLARRVKKMGIEQESVYDFVLWIILGSMIGARLIHIGLYEPMTYIQHPAEIFKIWHGGLSSFGGFLGAAVAIWFFLKRKGTQWLSGISFKDFSGIATVPLLVGWLIGRFGCVMIHDHPGIACNCLLAVNNPDQPFLELEPKVAGR